MFQNNNDKTYNEERCNVRIADCVIPRIGDTEIQFNVDYLSDKWLQFLPI